MNTPDPMPNVEAYLHRRPDAYAIVRGSPAYPDILGTVRLYRTAYGTVVVSTVRGLPTATASCASPIFAFHIHDGGSCSGTDAAPFEHVRMHYNPGGCPHPHHAGDLPPLFGAGGYAFGAVLTDRFSVDDVVGKTVVIHASADDFTSQPAGNAGTKIACGEIVARRPRSHRHS